VKTIVVNNQKGGVGKTMLAVHLAWFLAEERGARVLFIDLDPQGNASYTLDGERNGGSSSALFFGPDVQIEGLPGITVLRADEKLHSVEQNINTAVPAMAKRFAALKDQFDFCVIDTPPTWGGRNFAALLVTDYVISPIDLEDYSLQGVGTLRKQVKLVEDQARGGRRIGFLGLLPSRLVSNSPRQREHLKTLIHQGGTSLMFQGVITQRQGYAEALSTKTPVWTIKKSAAQDAARELRGVLATIKDRMAASIPA
jgi:chromosome partitioning protein